MLKIIINKALQNLRAFESFEFFELLKSQNTLTSINNEIESNNR